METMVLLLFCAVLLVFVVTGLNILAALLLGLVIFVVYAAIKGYGMKEIAIMIKDGVFGARNVIIVFMLIGILTALWRECGTIPAVICYSMSFIGVKTFVVMTFLLCCTVSVLTGTSFGTAATMGVICMTMAKAMDISPAITGGAILAGSFFGDRCSPVSTSALLVSELTGTSIFDNIRAMIKTATVPFLTCIVLYTLLGFSINNASYVPDLTSIFSSEFNISPIMLLPCAAIILLSLFKVKVKLAMTVGILTAAIICLFVNGQGIKELLFTAFYGYHSENAEISTMLDGGGIVSMLRVAAIVCISSAYAGIFAKTGILHSITEKIQALSQKTTVYTAVLLTSVIASVVSCNQTLSIMLTHQLSKHLFKDKKENAISLEDTAVVVAPLVPWSIACAVPLTSTNSPTSSVLFAFFLYLLPIYRLILSFIHKVNKRRNVHENA